MFTDMTIRTLPLPVQGRVTIWDDASPLGVRITAKGSKTFVVMLGKRRHTIGRYGDVTLSQARTAAKQLKAEQTLGRLLPSSRSVSDACGEYLKGITIRSNTRRYYERNLRSLPDCRLVDVDAADLNHVLDKLSPTSRSQALRSFIAFFNWCIRRHYLDVSPCIRFRPDRATARERVLSDEELKAVWTAADAMTDPFRTIVKLLMLTGQRRSEIASIQLSWIKSDRINFPKEICKNGRDHSLPLGAYAAQLLTAMQHSPQPFTNWSNAKSALEKASGVSGFTLHDLRRTFATRLAELGVAPHVIERLLNHVTGSLSPIARVYNKARYIEEMRAAIDLWEAKLNKILNEP